MKWSLGYFVSSSSILLEAKNSHDYVALPYEFLSAMLPFVSEFHVEDWILLYRVEKLEHCAMVLNHFVSVPCCCQLLKFSQDSLGHLHSHRKLKENKLYAKVKEGTEGKSGKRKEMRNTSIADNLLTHSTSERVYHITVTF